MTVESVFMIQMDVEMSKHHHILPPSLHLNSALWDYLYSIDSITIIIGGMSWEANFVVVRKSRLCKRR